MWRSGRVRSLEHRYNDIDHTYEIVIPIEMALRSVLLN